jgi:hypothetical protein
MRVIVSLCACFTLLSVSATDAAAQSTAAPAGSIDSAIELTPSQAQAGAPPPVSVLATLRYLAPKRLPRLVTGASSMTEARTPPLLFAPTLSLTFDAVRKLTAHDLSPARLYDVVAASTAERPPAGLAIVDEAAKERRLPISNRILSRNTPDSGRLSRIRRATSSHSLNVSPHG